MPLLCRFARFFLFSLGMVSCFYLGCPAYHLAIATNPPAPGNDTTTDLRTTTLAPAAVQPQVATAYGWLPLYFIANWGQVDQRVRYYVKGGGQTTFFTKDEVVLALSHPPAKDPRPGGTALRLLRDGSEMIRKEPATTKRKLSVVRMKPVGLQKGVTLAAMAQTEHRVNYFIGNDPKKWRSDIPTYQAVVYENAYAGIDLKFYGQGRQLEYDIVVKPGADPNQVQFAYQGVKRLEVTPTGDLALVLPDGGRLLQKKPLVYQEMAGQKVPVDGRFRLCGRGAQVTCGFAVAAYDAKRPLVIDPVLDYSTYLGGSSSEEGYGIAVDATGAAYVTGDTASSDFPTQQAYQDILPTSIDLFVTKLSPSGDALVYSTYLSGSDDDYSYGIAVDAAGAAYITGKTYSVDFPTRQAYQGTLGAYHDAFVTKLSPSGDILVYSTYLGGSDLEEGHGIAVDAAGAAYVTGWTTSSDFPTYRAYQGTLKGWLNAFIAKLSPSGNALAYATYLGGNSLDEGYGIAVDETGAAYVMGITLSTDFPTHQAFQTTLKGGQDVFITKLNPSGDALVYSTYLGGSGSDNTGSHSGNTIAVDATGAAYVTGATDSPDFPTQQPYQAALRGQEDAFIVKLQPNGKALVYSTYLGGSDYDSSYAIAVDAAGAAHVTGWTISSDFPTLQALQPIKFGECAVFIAKLSPSGSFLAYSTYLGGSYSQQDRGQSIAVDAAGAAYVTGCTYSNYFPTQQAYQGTLSGSTDAFVTKLTPAFFSQQYNLALDNHLLTFTSEGSTPWFRQTEMAHSGESAAQSGIIYYMESSRLQTTVVGPGELVFFWKVNSLESSNELSVWRVAYDRRTLYDYEPFYTISGVTDWQEKRLPIPQGTHIVQWQYSKNAVSNSGLDCGWLDRVSFIPTGISLNKALDNYKLEFRTSLFPKNWCGGVYTALIGGSAARSPEIDNSLDSWLETLVTGPGELSFFWKVSSEPSGDYLELTLDGDQVAKISGEIDWRRQTLVIPAGCHIVRWSYTKNDSGTAGEDCGWVDGVEFTSTEIADLNNALDNRDLAFATGSSSAWIGQSLAGAHGGSAAASVTVGNNTHSWLKTVVRGPGQVSFNWKVSSEADHDFLEVYLDSVLQGRISGEADWRARKVIIPPGEHALVWLYVKDQANAAGADRGYVDRVSFKRPSLPPLQLLLE